MKFSGLDLLFLEVNSLEESLNFYHGVLGFELEKNNAEAEPPIATLRAGNLKVTLAQHLETMLRRGRGVSFFVGVENVDDYYSQLSQRGVQVSAPIEGGWGGRFITVEDPDKYRLFFVEWNETSSADYADYAD